MQTFLPYANFERSAKVLDWRRLGKQRLEALDIYRILTGKRLGASEKQMVYLLRRYKHHPAVHMWKGYEEALKLYMNICIREWKRRGYRNNMKRYKTKRNPEMPWWFGKNKFHSAHRSNLLRKDYYYYSQFEWSENEDQEYWWPVRYNDA